MLKYFAAIIILLFNISAIKAQQLPGEDDTVNYRLAGFYDNKTAGTHSYLLKVAIGRQTNKDDFEKNIIIRQYDTSNKIISILPAFGKEYTWSMSTTGRKKKVITEGRLHHFTTGMIGYVDTAKHRMEIIDKAKHHKDLLVFFSDSKTLYNMQGEALWYLPPIKDIADEFTNVRDIKVTSDATITFLSGKLCEVDYNGNVIWRKAMNKKVGVDDFVYYHHEFTKRPNERYMAAIHNTSRVRVNKEDIDTTGRKRSMAQAYKTIEGITYREFPTGGLQEFDSAGTVVWSWILPQTLLYDTGFITKTPSTIEETSPHLNSFFFDEPNNNIYIGYRNNSSIVKIKYPSGEVLNVYKGEDPASADFSAQHHVTLDRNGNILLFSNNFLVGKDSSTNGRVSHIVSLKEPATGNKLKKIWDYPCDIDTLAPAFTGTGGSASQLSDGCILSTMGTAGRTFIVNKDKEIIWNVLTKGKIDPDWHNFGQYRVFPVEDRDLLFKIIFGNLQY